MKLSIAMLKMLSVMCVVVFACSQLVLAQEGSAKPPTKTIVGDLLMVDRDFYIVRGEYGEIQIEATHKTKMSEEFQFGDRIKAVVLMNNKALTIDRASAGDVAGVVENASAATKAPPADSMEKGKAKAAAPVMAPTPKQPEQKTIIADLLMIDGDFYIVRGEYGEIQIEATYKTDITEEFKFGDRIKALVLKNNKALKIERAGANDVPGVITMEPTSAPVADAAPVQSPNPSEAKSPDPDSGKMAPRASPSDTKIVKGQVLMVDGDFYVLRGEYGEIRVERTDNTTMTEEFKFGDFIKATVKSNDEALRIERLQ